MKRTNKRDKLIKVGSQIVTLQGYKAASINEILTAANVPKGSFYYYFSSKEDFGLAIIENLAWQYQNKLESFLQDEQFSPLSRLRNLFESKIADMESCQCTDGCSIGNLAQELSTQNELFRNRLNQIFIDWERHFFICLTAAYRAGEIADDAYLQDIAKFILSGWEGAILRAKVTKSVVPMKNFVRILFEQILI